MTEINTRFAPSHRLASFCAVLLLAAAPALWASGGRLQATGGATQIEGTAGGGLVPWAVLAGYATRDEIGGSAFLTRVELNDYRLTAGGVAVNVRNRLELSLAHQDFELGTLGRALGLGNISLRQNIFGAKLRLAGDLVYGDIPQMSVGVQHKRHLDFAIPSAVGARDDSGTDVYVSATRLFLDGPGGYNWLANATLRATRANELGLLGFGGDRRDSRRVVAEVSAAMLLNRRWAVGAEYRQKPDNLGFASERDWYDVFVAWFPNKRVSAVLAYANTRSIAGLGDQDGIYLSLEVAH